MHAEIFENPHYQVETVEKIDTPNGMSGTNWHRYVIRRKGSAIEGMQPGTLKSVTQHAESVASDLNDRAGGRASSAYGARKRTNITK
jgi:hypothetical protein